MEDSDRLATYLQQQHKQSAMQLQMPQQMQQTRERIRDATTAAMIAQNHQTGWQVPSLHSATTSAHWLSMVQAPP